MKKIILLLVILAILPLAIAEEATKIAETRAVSGGGQATAVSTEEPQPTATSTTVKSVCGQNDENLRKELDYAIKKADIAKQENNEQGVKEVEVYIKALKEKLEYNKKSCWQPEAIKAIPATAVAPTVTSTSASNIVTYYQVEMNKILNEKESINDQIISLKELKTKIDLIIKELIEKQQGQTIQAEEYIGIVEEFKIKPQEIKVNDVVVSTDKELVKEINSQEIKIKPTRDKVTVNVGNIEASTSQQVAVSDIIKVGDIELKAMPDTINVKGSVKSIEIIKENEKLVYLVKSEENRNLLGFIPMKSETTSQLDATTANAPLIKEAKPWWFVLSSEVKEVKQ